MNEQTKKILEEMEATGFKKFIVIGVKNPGEGDEQYLTGRGHNFTNAAELMAARETLNQMVQELG